MKLFRNLYLYIYIYRVCWKISNANTIKQCFSLKRYKNKLPCRFRPISPRHLCFPSIGLPLFTVIYCCCERIGLKDTTCIDALLEQRLFFFFFNFFAISHLVFTVACMSKVLKFTAHIKFFNQTQTVTFSISVLYLLFYNLRYTNWRREDQSSNK